MGFGIQTNSSITDAWSRQQAVKQQQIGLVGSGAPLSSVTNVSDKEEKSRQLELAAGFSFSDQIKANSLSNEETQKSDGDSLTAEQIAENKAQAEAIGAKFFSPDEFLTDQDKEFLDSLSVSDDVKNLIKFSIALNRDSGALSGPLSADFFMGNNGILTTTPGFTNLAISNGGATSASDVANQVGSLGNEILKTLLDCGLATQEDVDKYSNQLAGKGMAMWVENFKQQLENDKSLMDTLNDPEKRAKIQGFGVAAEEARNFVDNIEASQKQLA